MGNWGRGLHSRDNLLRVTSLVVCPPDTQSCKTVMKASLPAGRLSPSPFFEFGMVIILLMYCTQNRYYVTNYHICLRFKKKCMREPQFEKGGNQKEIENMNRPITSTEIETVIKNLSTNKTQSQMASQSNSIRCLEKS